MDKLNVKAADGSESMECAETSCRGNPGQTAALSIITKTICREAARLRIDRPSFVDAAVAVRLSGRADKIDVSLIICTRNRCEQLARCLESVAAIRFERSWELIIVDNGSADRTSAVAQGFTGPGGVLRRYVFEPTPGLARGHNAGIRNAAGSILVFIDDDCYPADDFLSHVWTAFADQSVGYIGGRILLHDPTDYPATINESVTPRIFPAGSFVPLGTIQGANMAFRREALVDIGGFDPLFGPGAPFVAEDIDAVSRASCGGWKGLYCPEAVVRHHHGRKAADIPALAKSYAIGRGAWHMKLLLQEHQFRHFAKGLSGFPRRFRWEPRALWEAVGAASYIYQYLVRTFCRQVRRGREGTLGQ